VGHQSRMLSVGSGKATRNTSIIQRTFRCVVYVLENIWQGLIGKSRTLEKVQPERTWHHPGDSLTRTQKAEGADSSIQCSQRRPSTRVASLGSWIAVYCRNNPQKQGACNACCTCNCTNLLGCFHDSDTAGFFCVLSSQLSSISAH
jgi:Tfp pilus assembly protein PilV